jgi:hypothetical protein
LITSASRRTSAAYNDALAQAQHFFQAQGASLAHWREYAFGWVGQTVGSQSALLAYVDVFWVSSIFALCMVPPVMLPLKRMELGAARAAVH